MLSKGINSFYKRICEKKSFAVKKDKTTESGSSCRNASHEWRPTLREYNMINNTTSALEPIAAANQEDK